MSGLRMVYDGCRPHGGWSFFRMGLSPVRIGGLDRVSYPRNSTLEKIWNKLYPDGPKMRIIGRTRTYVTMGMRSGIRKRVRDRFVEEVKKYKLSQV